MADDLVARRVLEGKTRQEILDLLGPPPPTDKFSDWSMVYWLGDERGYMPVDSEWLVIRLEYGRVAKVKLVAD